MRADESFASAAVAAGRPTRRDRLRSMLGTGAFWLLGSAVAALAQPTSDRSLAAVGAAAAGIATILVVSRLTRDPDRRYFRSLVGTMVAVSVVGDWLLQRLTGSANSFQLYGLDTRIALPLIVVLLAPLVLRAIPSRLRSRALWVDRALVLREARPLDWLVVAYAFLILPTLALGLAHHAPKTYIAQDLGLIVFFVFAYVAGRAVSAQAGRVCAVELVYVLLLLGAAQALLGWDTTPIYTYVEAAYVGAIGFALLQPRRALRLPLSLAVVLAVVLLVRDVVAVKNGSGSTTAVELAAALAVIAYLAVRVRNLVPQWVAIGVGVAAVAGFLVFTSDGATVRGQYLGPDQSNLGRTYEADQVREAIHASPVSFVFGRGLGGNIDETHAPKLFADSLLFGGRDLAHVQEVHLLPYEFLLKHGLLGFAWLAAFVVAVAFLGIRALETAARHRDPTPVVYVALPLLGLIAALAASTHFQDNPLNAFALGVLVTRLEPRTSPSRVLRFAIPAAAVVWAAVGALAFSGTVTPFPSPAGGALVTTWKTAAVVGDVRFTYPPQYHRRYFATTSYAVTGVHGTRVHGVVVANYPLKRSPELGGAGESLPLDGVFFELYQAPRKGFKLGAKKKLPLILFDFPAIRHFIGKTLTTEQGAAHFRVGGRNYQAILWVGKHAPKSELLTVDYIIDSIGVNPR